MCRFSSRDETSELVSDQARRWALHGGMLCSNAFHIWDRWTYGRVWLLGFGMVFFPCIFVSVGPD